MADINSFRVLKIAVPVVLSNATVPLIGVVDTAVVGQSGLAAPIGAVGAGALILSTLYLLFGFLRMGTTGLAGQALGAGDQAEVTALLSRALLIGVVSGLVMVLLQKWIFTFAFAVSPVSDAVETLARDYVSTRILSAPATIALFGITGWLIALERMRAVVALQLVVNLLNIVLDFHFVLNLGWGVWGVGLASCIAEWLGFLLGLWLCRRAFFGDAWRDGELVFDMVRLANMARVNADIFLRAALLQGIMVFFFMRSAGFGDLTLAANQILLQFLTVAAFALDGFAYTAETLVARAVGRRDRALFSASTRLTLAWALVFSVVLVLGFAICGGLAIDFMSASEKVRAEARVYLPYMIALPFFAVWAFMLDGVFIGATQTTDMRNSMALAFIVFLVAQSVLTALWGNHGLWLAYLITLVVRTVVLALRYRDVEERTLSPHIV